MSGLKYIVRIIEIIFKPFSKIKHFKSDCCTCECDNVDEIIEEEKNINIATI